MSFIDMFVVAVPTDTKETYIGHLKTADTIFKEHGAVRVVECWGVDVPDGKLTSFPMAVKCEPGETVAMGWIEWPSKAHRDEAMPKAMQAMSKVMTGMPFDGKRLIFGGFDVLFEM